MSSLADHWVWGTALAYSKPRLYFYGKSSPSSSFCGSKWPWCIPPATIKIWHMDQQITNSICLKPENVHILHRYPYLFQATLKPSLRHPSSLGEPYWGPSVFGLCICSNETASANFLNKQLNHPVYANLVLTSSSSIFDIPEAPTFPKQDRHLISRIC